jgi:hypothetical protein
MVLHIDVAEAVLRLAETECSGCVYIIFVMFDLTRPFDDPAGSLDQVGFCNNRSCFLLGDMFGLAS